MQRLPTALTPLDTALRALCAGVGTVAATELPLAQALRCVAAQMPPLRAWPTRDLAATDGWALSARDVVGASSYAPTTLPRAPVWVETGDAMPDGCDCVLDTDLVDLAGSIAQVLAEAVPGQGLRRVGGDIAEASLTPRVGQPVGALDLLVARAAGLRTLAVRRPRLRLVDIPAGADMTAQMIAEQADAAGIVLTRVSAPGRDAASIALAFDADAADLVVSVGGAGVGRTDATIIALARRGQVLAHGIALQPGGTAAVGRIGAIPVVALPGRPEQALAGWWTLVLPLLDQLAMRGPRRGLTLPLARKISSSIGITDIALLEMQDAAWVPLAVGDLSLDGIARADAWLAVSATSEGFAAGTPVEAALLRLFT